MKVIVQWIDGMNQYRHRTVDRVLHTMPADYLGRTLYIKYGNVNVPVTKTAPFQYWGHLDDAFGWCDLCGKSAGDKHHLVPDPDHKNGILTVCAECYADSAHLPNDHAEERVRY